MRKLVRLLLLALSLPVAAQTPYLVKDINTTRSRDIGSSEPADFAALRNRTFFVAKLPASGTELWSTDGSSGGTSIVADIIPGPASSNPFALRAVNDVLLFNAGSVDHGAELWVTDGTAAGTRRLVDINPGPTSSTPGARFVHNNRMLFSADDGTNGRELWITDGTAAGTRLLKDLNPGSAGSFPAYFTAFGNSVYFGATGGLWKTDGTEGGTVKVTSGSMRNLVAAGAQLFFEGFTSATGWELWVSDGTEAGTRMVTEILPGSKGALTTAAIPSPPITPLGSRVLFVATDDVHGREMWSSDGTAAGTRMLRDFIPGSTGTWDGNYTNITVLGERAFFGASDPEHGRELWVTDGTPDGTTLFADLAPGPAHFAPSVGLTAGGKLFFSAAYSYLYGTRLWVTDGSVEGTRIVNAAGGAGFGINGSMRVIDGKLWFAGLSPLHGEEPWVSDGTEAGTRMVANIAPDGAPSSRPGLFAATKDLLFFYATEGVLSPTSNVAEYSLWRSDGTADGTFKLRESGQHPPALTAAGSLVLFDDHIDHGKLLVSDGTVEGTKPADQFLSRFGGREVESFFPMGDTLFAAVEDTIFDTTLWKTSGVPNAPATRLGSNSPYGLIEVAGHHFFYGQAPENTHDRGLWTTDGTPAGTYALVPDLDANYHGVSPLGEAAGTVFWLQQRHGEKTMLWKSDGTVQGTVAVKEVPVGTYRLQFRGAGRKVFFAATSPTALWVSDGTEAGTVELLKFELFPYETGNDLHAAGDRVVFAQYRNEESFELWSSDGTPAGTRMLMKLPRGYPALASIDGIVYFAGTDDLHGAEVWTTDGTPEGTKLLADVNPGPASSSPGSFTKVGDLVYFSAHSAAVGDELWALPPAQPVVSIGDARVPEGDAGTAGVVRFEVSLGPAPRAAVTFDYATADGTARAGEDYEAAAGTLTFAPGETRKTVEVRVLGDLALEGNERFFVTLRNARGARLAENEVTGIIGDDDEAADLSVTPAIGVSGSGVYDTVRVANQGPSTASDVNVTIASTPFSDRYDCRPCYVPQIASGASALTGLYPSSTNAQTYLSAVATARQEDPQPSNNTASWTVNANRTMAMNAAYLVTGATATISAYTFSSVDPPVSSSDASVLTVSSVARNGNAVTLTVTALKPGTSVVSIGGDQSSLLVTVAAPGTTPRWPGGLSIATGFTAVRFDEPVMLTVTATGQAPFSSATPTGTVVVTSAGTELARATIRGTVPIHIPVYFRSLGAVTYEIAYGGDANFLPDESITRSVFVRQGNVSITGGLEVVSRAAGTYSLELEVAGSPVVAPTGIISVVDGTRELARVSLVPQSGGTSRAQVTLLGLPPLPTVTINYLGDPFYAAASQQMRVVTPKRRSARH